MAAHVITLDCGTTNTRAVLWQGETVLATARSDAGVRDTARTGSTAFLAAAVAACLQELTAKGGIAPSAVAAVLASGMITSNLGLAEIPHRVAPAGMAELAAGMTEVFLPEVWPSPLWFVAGVRPNQGKVAPDDIPATDMMRGEETEVMALLEALKPELPCWLALPGSHSKYIPLDGQGRILGSRSTLTGEMFQALATQTILASSVSMTGAPKTAAPQESTQQESSSQESAWLIRGFLAARRYGLGRALYCTRLSQLWTESTVAERTAHLLGAVLESDIHLLREDGHASPDTPIWVAGRGELQEALITLLRHDGYFRNVREVPRNLDNLAGRGALALARLRGII